MKQIAAWAATHPDWTDDELCDLFKCEVHQVRYARKKFAELSALAQNTAKGKQMLGGLINEHVDDNEALKTQVHKIISDLEADSDMKPSPRLKLIKEVMIIKEKIQKTGLVGHLRALDAELVGLIIRRFAPNVNDDDVIKIYNEEKKKLAVSNVVRSK